MILGYEAIVFYSLIFLTFLVFFCYYLFKLTNKKLFLIIPQLFSIILTCIKIVLFQQENVQHVAQIELFFFLAVSVLTATLILVSNPIRVSHGDYFRTEEIFLISSWTYFTDSLIVFSIFWILSLFTLNREIKSELKDLKHAVFLWHQFMSTVALICGIGLIYYLDSHLILFSSVIKLPQNLILTIALFCFIFAAFVREGIFPFHLWIKSCLEVNPFPVKIAFLVSNFGFFLFLKLVIPIMDKHYSYSLRVLAIYAVVGGLYMANLASIQKKVRMVFMYIMLSQFSSLFAGLALNSDLGNAVVLFQFMALGLSFAGVFSLLYLLELYVGSMHSRKFYGLQEKNVGISYLMLIFCLISSAIPLSMNFIGEDILFHSLISKFPVLGPLIVCTSLINGITTFQTYSYMFNGINVQSFDSLVLLNSTQRFGYALLTATCFAIGVFPMYFLQKLLLFF